MKILTIRLEPENANYDNMLKYTKVYCVKQNADIIAFQGVKYGSYGGIREYLHKFDFHSYLHHIL